MDTCFYKYATLTSCATQSEPRAMLMSDDEPKEDVNKVTKYVLYLNSK